MAYDALAESIRLLAEGPPDVPFSLTRRRRFLPVACDVDGDAAATLFVRRGVSGNPWLESWTLRSVDGRWTMLGGGAGDHYEELFAPRPTLAELGGPLRLYSGGQTFVDRGLPLPLPRRSINTASFRLATEVHSVLVAERRIEIAAHGVGIVVWRSHRPPRLTALDDAGVSLGEIDVTFAR